MDPEREGAVPELAAVTASPAANLEDKPGASEGRVQGDHGAGGWKVPGHSQRCGVSGAPRAHRAEVEMLRYTCTNDRRLQLGCKVGDWTHTWASIPTEIRGRGFTAPLGKSHPKATITKPCKKCTV